VPSLRTLEVIAQGFELTLFPERFRRAVWKRPCLTWRFSHAQITFTVFQLPSPAIPDSYPGERSDGVPPPRVKMASWGMPVTGGTYLRLLPYGVQLLGLNRMARRAEPVVLYFHP